jgi:hypothetical protein
MKTMYLFCGCSGEITTDTLFVDVYVGRSKQDQRDCGHVAQLAREHNYFFQLWSRDVRDFLDRIADSLAEPDQPCLFQPRRVALGVRQLRRLLVDGSFSEFVELFTQTTRHLHRMGFSDYHAHAAATERASQTYCNAANVKNLKPLKLAL